MKWSRRMDQVETPFPTRSVDAAKPGLPTTVASTVFLARLEGLADRLESVVGRLEYQIEEEQQNGT